VSARGVGTAGPTDGGRDAMTRYVVAGVDGSQAAFAAARWAAAEAGDRGCALRVTAAVPPERPRGADAGTGPRHTEVLRRAVADLAAAHPGLDVEARQITGAPQDVLNDSGRAAELLVVGTRGLGGFPGLRLGSVALAVAAGAPCAVALVPGDSGAVDRVPEVAVGVDAHDPDDRALELAFATAQRREARLRAVCAWQLPAPYANGPLMPVEEDRAGWEDQELQLLENAVRGWRGKYPGACVVPDMRLFGAADALVRASATADLLVVGRGGARAAHGFGGVAHAVAHHTRCPLLLAPRH
jgi:nucleotide-binding universal stress UspA family protein